MTKEEAEKRIGKLRQEIEYHRYLYHVLDRQEISDAALDSLKHELAKLEEQYPELITPTSPTQRVGGKPLPEFKHVRHQLRMLSLTDAFSREELVAWEERNKKIVPHDFDYFVQPKIDGVAVALLYQDGQFVQGATRGDGVVGEDVTHNLKTIEAIPLTLRQAVRGRLEVRGEVHMLKRDFERFNAKRRKAGHSPFANPRNLAAGSIRQLDPKVTAERPLRFFAWEITAGMDVTTRQEEYDLLKKLGFPVPPNSRLLANLPAVFRHLKREERRRPRYPFQCDGAVVKINNLEQYRRLGVVGKAPRGAIAYKFAAEEATTVVEDIVVQVGRTGALTPVAHLTPVSVAGTTVSRATLHNADEIKRKDVRIGDTVIVHKAGDIIPEVKRVLTRLRPPGTKSFAMPKRCPVCGSKVKREVGGVVVRCTNARCFPQQRERILHAVGDDGFDIDGLGDKIIEQLLQAGLIKDPPDLWQLEEGDLIPLERFAQKSAAKLIEEIRAHRRIPLARFLVALGIPQVGTVTAQDLAREFRSLDRLMVADQQALESISGVGPKVAESIVRYLRQTHTKDLINQYRAVGVEVTAEKGSGPLRGKTFVFTGGMPDMSRDEAKQRVMALGGKVASTVGEHVDYVVLGEEPGSKAAKAKQLGLTMLTPAQFKRMIQKG